jgi:N-hydroxyarylamine O-acetyltransferase
MISTGFPLPEYLERIGLSNPPSPNESGLQQLHSAQAFSIPFENIDIHLGRPISLKPEDLVEKFLRRKRGGYCFELNGIFRMALAALGFSFHTHLARVLYGRKDAGARTHQIQIVTISGRKWLADVGFGGPGLRSAMPLAIDQVCEQFGEHYRLRQDLELGTVLQKKTGDGFLDLYAFNENELTLEVDIETANHVTSTWPLSIFRLRRMCFLANPRGRVTLSDMDLTIYRDGQSVSRTLPSGPEYMAAIAKHFGIVIDARYKELKPLGNP